MKLEKHIHFETIDSTNTWAKTHLDQWANQGLTLITAAGQTAGRGRFKRRWESPFHLNIYATFCFWLDANRLDVGHIPQLLALAAAYVLEKHHFLPTIKWPNDVLLSKKKVAGILCETVIHESQRGVICGIGLNVNMPVEFANLIDKPATSLLIERNSLFDIKSLQEDLVNYFISLLKKFLMEGFDSFFPLFQSRSAFKKGESIRFHDNQTLIEAQFENLFPDGSVELRLQHGELKTFHAGEFLF